MYFLKSRIKYKVDEFNKCFYLSRKKDFTIFRYSPLPKYDQVLQTKSNSGINTYMMQKGKTSMTNEEYKIFMLYFLEDITIFM